MRVWICALALLPLAGAAIASDWKVVHTAPNETVYLADFDSATATGPIATFWLKIDSRIAEGASGGVYTMKTELRCISRTWGWYAWSDYDFNEKLKDSRTQIVAKQFPIEPDTALDYVRAKICDEMSLKALNMKRQGIKGANER